MFSKCINNNLEPFLGEMANDLFPNIDGEDTIGDSTFVATLRALLNNRLPKEQSLHFSFCRMPIPRAKFEGLTLLEFVGNNFQPFENDALKLYSLQMSDENADGLFSLFDDETVGFACHTNYSELKDITQYVSQYMKARFYVNEDINSVVIFIINADLRKIHFVQSMIPRYFKRLFANNPFTEIEKRVLIGLTDRSAMKYEEAMAELADTIDTRTIIINKLVGNFERRAREQQVATLENEIDKVRREINDNMRIYRNLIDTLDLNIVSLEGLHSLIDKATENSELMEYLYSHKNVDPCTTDGSRFSFFVSTYIENFDTEMYRAIRNRGTLVNDFTGNIDIFRAAEDRQLFLDALFGAEPKFRVKVVALFTIDIRGDVQAVGRYSYPAKYKNYLPSPHLDYHRCLGTNRTYIIEALRKGDTIMAMEQCIGSAKMLNFAEVPQTVGRFMNTIYNSKNKIIELPDGSSVTPGKALNWLKSQEKE